MTPNNQIKLAAVVVTVFAVICWVGFVRLCFFPYAWYRAAVMTVLLLAGSGLSFVSVFVFKEIRGWKNV